MSGKGADKRKNVNTRSLYFPAVPNTNPGPGAYSPDSFRGNKGFSMSGRMSERRLAPGADTPGPGYYDPATRPRTSTPGVSLKSRHKTSTGK